MRKIIVGAQVSLDGVMQAPGGPTEDPTKAFKFGGWSIPYFDEVAGGEIGRLFSERYDLLLGRKTYEIFAAYWPFYDHDGEHGEIARQFDAITKYVVSGSGEVDTGWKGTQLLRDIAAVKALKQGDGPNLITQGSTELVHALLAADLVDELSVFTAPVVRGGGKKLFADGSAAHAYELTGSCAAPSGMVIAHYARGGAVRIANAGFDHPTDRERARQERMTREG
jgi:dihydrofolate reductase